MVAIIDYDAGNIKSVENAMKRLGQQTVVTREAAQLQRAGHVVLPGVGSFGDAMARIRSFGLEATIRETAQSGTPFLGICLGLQLLFEESEESPGARGLGLLPGRIRRIPGGRQSDGTERKVPQIGWNSLAFPHQSRLFAAVPEGAFVYFVHSYYLDAADKSIVTATAPYGVTVEAAVERGNLFACQFHPEKSAEVGMQILENFLRV